MHLFGVVQAHRTSSNLLEPHHYKDSKVCRVLSHEFGVVRLYRTFSIYIVTEIARCAGCLCTCSGWFKHIEPHRTFSNHIITEIARCLEFCHMRSGWFDCTEPSLSTSLQGKQGVQGAYALVRGGSTIPNLLCLRYGRTPRTHVTKLYTLCYLCNDVVREGSTRFDVLEPPRTSA